LPFERILTIIGAAPGDDPPNVREQGLKVGRQRIARAMQVPHHLIQVVAEADELAIDHPIQVVSARLRRGFYGPVLVKQNGAPEVDRPHANRLGASLDALELRRREAEIELPIAWL
jgi:hypothetical protein